MKRITKYLIMLVIFLVPILKVNALSLSKSELTIEPGKSDSVELYANIPEDQKVTSITVTVVFTDDQIKVGFRPNSSYTSSTSDSTHTFTFSDEGVSGRILLGTMTATVSENVAATSGTATAYQASARTVDGETLSLTSKTLTINVNKTTVDPEPEPEPASSSKQEEPAPATSSKREEPVVASSSKKEEAAASSSAMPEPIEVVDEGLLEKIDSELVVIKLEANTYKYTVYVDKSEVTELDLVPKAKDEEAKIYIETQKIAELENDAIAINVTKGETEQTYIIIVKDISEMPTIPDIEIDTGSFNKDNSYKLKWLVVIVGLVIVLVGSMFVVKKK